MKVLIVFFHFMIPLAIQKKLSSRQGGSMVLCHNVGEYVVAEINEGVIRKSSSFFSFFNSHSEPGSYAPAGEDG